MTRSRTLWLGLGITAGSEIGHSTVTLIIGIFIAFLPSLLYMTVHTAASIHRSMWHEIEEFRNYPSKAFPPSGGEYVIPK